MRIAEIMPTKDFKNRGALYTQGVAAYVEETAAKRWERDNYATIVETYDVAALIAASKTEDGEPTSNETAEQVENSEPVSGKKKSGKTDKGEA